MTYTIKLRRDSVGDWTTINPVLAEGEPGVEFVTNYLKVGDGVTPWNDLEYVVGPDTGGLPSAVGLPDNQMLVTLDDEWVIVDASAILDPGAAATIVTEYVTVDGQDTFVLPSAPVPGTVRVKRNGLQQLAEHWTLDELVLTLVTPCEADEDIIIEQDGPVGTVVGEQGDQGEQGEPGTPGAPGAPGADATRGPVTINDQTGTTYTLVLADATKWVRLSNASAITLTVPPNTDVAFPIGTQIEGSQGGAGQITIAPGSGVTINAVPGLKVAAQYGVFGLFKVDTNTWLAYGRLSA